MINDWSVPNFCTRKCEGSIYGSRSYCRRGSRSIFAPDLKIFGGIISHVRQKKSVPNTNFSPTLESPTITPLPPLAGMGHQMYHGGGSTSSYIIWMKKCPHQHITYPLGSALMWAFLFTHCFSCKTPFFTLKNRVNDDDNYIILPAMYY